MDEREGSVYHRVLDDGRDLTVYPMIVGQGRLCIGPADSGYYDDAWCYPTAQLAIEAAHVWDGEGDAPMGWHRHINSGRRRPDGDPRKEYVSR